MLADQRCVACQSELILVIFLESEHLQYTATYIPKANEEKLFPISRGFELCY